MCLCDRINCGYYYKGEDDDYPTCHCPDDLSPAPCEDDEPMDYEDEGGEGDDPDPFNENDPYVVTNPMAFY